MIHLNLKDYMDIKRKEREAYKARMSDKRTSGVVLIGDPHVKPGGGIEFPSGTKYIIDGNGSMRKYKGG